VSSPILYGTVSAVARQANYRMTTASAATTAGTNTENERADLSAVDLVAPRRKNDESDHS